MTSSASSNGPASPHDTSLAAPPVTYAEVTVADDTVAPSGAPCPGCGAPVDGGDNFCIACGRSRGGAPMPHVAEEAAAPTQKFFRCSNCGAEVATDPERRSYVCPFCDSTYVVEFSRDQSERRRPEFVIGFAVTRDEAEAKFRRWIRRNRWFRPGDLAEARIVEKLQGVYLPFWSFAMRARSHWSATIAEHWYRTERYTTTVNGKRVTRTRQVQETEWWPLSGRHHRFYTGYLVSGSGGLAQDDAERIKPFYLPALKRYEPYFLAGWVSEEYSVEEQQARARCEQEFLRRERRNVESFLPGDGASDVRVETGFHDVSSDLILLPVYLLSYRYGEKVYRFLLNGQTGKVAGDKPVSSRRIGVAVAVVVAVVAALVLLSFLANR